MIEPPLTRRAFSIGLMAFPALTCTGFAQSALAQGSLPAMKVSKDPNCGCCNDWISYLRKAGLTVAATNAANMNAVKKRLGVPEDLASCHTAEIGGYVIEGHVPFPTIRKLFAEKPNATGLAVPGMPQSSPGMDVPGSNDVYEVILFGPKVRKRFARFRGRREI